MTESSSVYKEFQQAIAEIEETKKAKLASLRQIFWDKYPLIDEVIVTFSQEYDDQGGYYVSLRDFEILFKKELPREKISQFLTTIDPVFVEMHNDGDEFSEFLDEWEDLKIFIYGKESLEVDETWFFSRVNNTFFRL